MKLLFTLCLLASPALACPSPDRSTESAVLFETLATAEGFSDSSAAAGAIWQFWQTAPDQQAQDLLDDGLARIRYADYANAKSVLTELTAYCPDYPEGYNQLAFAQFLNGEYDASADNLRKTLEFIPNHFGALSGMGLIAQRQGNIPAAKIWIKRAVEYYPFMSERAILDIPDDADEL